MKMAKANEKDICAAGDAMSVLSDISSGYYPKREGDDCDDTLFDPDEPSHLRKFYDLMNATLDTSPGWPGRVIGGMCFVILYDKNQIIDPTADTLELHPRFAEASTQRDKLSQALDEWIEKTEWLQKTATPAELGMHRADVLAKRLTDTLNVLASAHCGYQAKLRELETQKNELLKQALEALSTCSGVAHWPTLEPVKDKLRAAIAKAEGGAA